MVRQNKTQRTFFIVLWCYMCWHKQIIYWLIEKTIIICNPNKKVTNNTSYSSIKCLVKLSFSLFLFLHPHRSWRTDLCKGSCALVCVSVEHDDSPRMGAVRGVVLESQYLLEPCGMGRTRLTHISRVDLRCGRTSRALIVKVLINICKH